MAAPKFASMGCNGDQDGVAVPTGRQLTLPRSGQQSPLSTYCVQALTPGVAVPTDRMTLPLRPR